MQIHHIATDAWTISLSPLVRKMPPLLLFPPAVLPFNPLSAMLPSVITHLQRRKEYPARSEAASFPAPSCFRVAFQKQIASFGRNQGARWAELWAVSLVLKTHGAVSSTCVFFRLCFPTCSQLRWIRWAAEDASAASCLYYAQAEGRVFPLKAPQTIHKFSTWIGQYIWYLLSLNSPPGFTYNLKIRAGVIT